MRIDGRNLFNANGSIKELGGKSLVVKTDHAEQTNDAAIVITPTYDQSLKAKILAIQALQKELGIESRAAIEPVTFLTEHAIEIGIGWLLSAFGSDAVKFLNENIIEPLGPDHKDLFATQSPIRQKAIDKLKQADVKDPQKIIKSTEKLIRIFLVKSLEYSEDKLDDAIPTARALISILEGLYQIDDSKSEKKIYLDSATKHGWQEHSSFLVGAQRVTGTISLFTNPLKWGTGWTKRLENLVGEADLTQERGWYNYNNVPDLMATLLEYCHSSRFPVLDEGARESIRRILVRNWKIPIDISNPASISVHGSKIPSTSRSRDYRLGIYETILKTLKVGNTLTTEDLLFLKTPISAVPSELQSKAADFRAALLTAYGNEVALQEVTPKQYSEPIVKVIEAILDESKEIPRWEWNETAKKQRAIELKNEERFTEFKRWGHVIPIGTGAEKYNETELRACFEKLNQQQKEALSRLQTFFARSKFASIAELNSEMKTILGIMNLSSQEESERLTQYNDQKGLYFFRYLNALIDKQVTITGSENKADSLKTHLDESNKNYLLAVCKLIVNNNIDFKGTPKNLIFYVSPYLDSVQGQALALHHKLSKHFDKQGYIDVHNLRDFVLTIVANNLSSTSKPGEKCTGGFLFSGPQGTGKSSFAIALSNQIAAPLIILTRDMITVSDSGITVKLQDKREIPLASFFHELKTNAPCVLLMDEGHRLLVPRSIDFGCVRKPTIQEETLTDAFLTNIQGLRDESGRSKVILIITTNYPEVQNVDISQMDEEGNCPSAAEELYKMVSFTATRDQRIDYSIFSFHKLYDELQGEALARHFLEPHITSGRVEQPSDYTAIAQVVKDYTPATIETAFNKAVAAFPERVVTIQELLDKLKTRPSKVKMLANKELVERLRSKVSSLVETDQIKQLVGELDYSALAIAAKGLKPLQIKKALEELTPETLTQENIIAAFEQVRKSGS